MAPNEAGLMVARWWMETANKFPGVEPDAFVVMPNHIHGIVIITAAAGADLRVRTGAPRTSAHPPGARTGAPLPEIVQWFKTMTTNEYIRGVRERGWTPFPGKLWQRNYYERVVGDGRESEAVRRYIAENPTTWPLDPENPLNTQPPPPPSP